MAKVKFSGRPNKTVNGKAKADMNFNPKIYNWWAGGSTQTIFDQATANWDLNTDGFDSLLVNNGTVQSTLATIAPIATSKLFDSSLDFTSNAKYVTIPDSSDVRLTGDAPCTFSLWYYPTSVTGVGFIASKRDATNAEWQILRNGSAFGFAIFSGGTSSVYISVSVSSFFTINTWHHIVVRYDGSKAWTGISVYKNGVAQTTTNASSGSYSAYTPTAALVYIGVLGPSGSPSNTANGYVNQLCYWKNKVLTQANINYIYNSGSGRLFTNPKIYSIKKIVLAQRDNYMFATDLTNLYWSNDGGATWINTYVWGSQWTGSGPATRVLSKAIGFAYIFSTGTVIFATTVNVYRSTNQLVSISDITSNVYQSDGVTPFVFHTPSNPSYPGAYFLSLVGNINPYNSLYGKEVCVWSNYCNVTSLSLGATPIQVWASDNDGATIKCIYQFGQNPNYRDDGTAAGGVTGTLLGNASNSVICRHSHGTFWNQSGFDFYTITGDFTGEVNWIKHTYNSDGTWTNTAVVSGLSPTVKWMSVSLNFQPDGTVIWSSDATSGGSTEYGFFSTSPANIGVSATQIANPWDSGSNRGESMYMDSRSTSLFTGQNATKTAFFLSSGRGTGTYVQIPITNTQFGVDGGFFQSCYYRNSRGFIKFSVSGLFDIPLKTIFLNP